MPATVLVIDNEPDQVDIMSQIIAKLGHEVMSAVSGTDALKLLEAKAVDIVFLDLIMPDMDGTELCERIKSLNPRAVVFAFSGHVALYDPEKLKKVGFAGTISKPIDIGQISRAIEDVLGAE